jgi:hypothetical protein
MDDSDIEDPGIPPCCFLGFEQRNLPVVNRAGPDRKDDIRSMDPP